MRMKTGAQLEMADAKIKVSELSVILDKNIDDKDLFLVSDRNNN